MTYHGDVCEDGLGAALRHNFLTDKVSKGGVLLPDVLSYLLVNPRLAESTSINSVRGMQIETESTAIDDNILD